ncbi:FAD-linked oxidoreductase-like protein [Cokeromyces recurvatus]|uniref:FAD-linked oxidoreductase-like protein n=1 Tax=Cokeromyces recurvatus TaxID=90255 RepID=UPI00221F6ACC|nr:FAD-linked oxidoreductase-like protein [Cokeromyces recurvatus]KAI7904569.1 FAD-linked oxidoreductase-like protein [Cokeromyces recurvatus]
MQRSSLQIRSILQNTRLLSKPFITPPPFYYKRSIVTTSKHVKTATRFPFKSITVASSLLLTSSFYFYSQERIAEAEPVAANHFNTTTTNTSPASLTLMELRDKENRIAVQAKDTKDLVMALFVYRLCAISWLVDIAPHLISLSQRLGLETPLYWFIKHTFFTHFCGGESPEECISSMDKLAESGINCILDLSVEADLEQQQVPMKVNEHYADKITKMIKTCIQTAAHSAKGDAMVAIKVTAFSPPELLVRLNQALATLDQAFLKHQRYGQIDIQGLYQVIHQVLPPARTKEQEEKRDTILKYYCQQQEEGDVYLDLIEFRKFFSFQQENRDVWWETNDKEDHSNVLLTAKDLAAYDHMMAHLEEVCGLAHELKVGVMVDAEQSYFQDAIDHVAHQLQRKFNKRHPLSQPPTVYNTYQMYTKSSQGRLELDVELAKRENFTFAAKLVRGAYMISERKRAEEMDYESPIHETLEETHASYNGGVQFLLRKIGEYQEQIKQSINSKETSPIVFMVASHNRDSVILTIEEMEKNNVSIQSGVVMFGQLFGMQDQLSYTLGHHGYAIYKYLPYGKIHEVIPYLLRRAQENSSVLGGVGIERQLMWNEMKDRLTGKKTSVSPEVPPTMATGNTTPSV